MGRYIKILTVKFRAMKLIILTFYFISTIKIICKDHI